MVDVRKKAATEAEIRAATEATKEDRMNSALAVNKVVATEVAKRAMALDVSNTEVVKMKMPGRQQGGYGGGQDEYGSGRQQYGGGQDEYGSGRQQGGYGGGQDEYGSGRQQYGGGQGEYGSGRQQGGYGGGQYEQGYGGGGNMPQGGR